jgi:hypothetical protein
MLRALGEAISLFLENKRPRWPRIVFPSLAILSISFFEGLIDANLVSSGILPASLVISGIVSFGLITGGIIYSVYFVTLHKLLRYATYRVFGLETYDLTLNILGRENLLPDGISPFKLTSTTGVFFLRKPKRTKIRDSIDEFNISWAVHDNDNWFCVF